MFHVLDVVKSDQGIMPGDGPEFLSTFHETAIKQACQSMVIMANPLFVRYACCGAGIIQQTLPAYEKQIIRTKSVKSVFKQ